MKEESGLEAQTLPRNDRVLDKCGVSDHFVCCVYLVSETNTGQL